MKTVTSKKAHSKRRPEKPLVTTASLAPSSVMAEVLERASQVIGCKVAYAHIVADFRHQICRKVSDFIVLYSGETAFWTQ